MADEAVDNLKTVVLNDRHLALGGRMVPFSGYSLPVQYSTGIIAEHKWTREHAGLFDVSHMGPSFLVLDDKSGDGEADHRAVAGIVEPLTCGDIVGLKPGQIRYTLLLTPEGGTYDDLMVARPATEGWGGALYIVVNAGTKEEDFQRIAAAALGKATLNRSDHCALLALQGPQAAEVMRGIIPDAADLSFMHYASFDWHDTKLVVSRSGYTGEDGFEILVDPQHAHAFWDALVTDWRVKPIGLGARDSLRLEAGLPLYGHDLDQSVSPVEAGLNFAVSRRRREAADIPGATRILAELGGKLERVRVGLTIEGAPAREGAAILDPSGAEIGKVTSGGFSPTLNRAIALGFVPPAHAAPGAQLQVLVRGRAQPATVVPTPFVPHRYVRKASA